MDTILSSLPTQLNASGSEAYPTPVRESEFTTARGDLIGMARWSAADAEGEARISVSFIESDGEGGTAWFTDAEAAKLITSLLDALSS